MSCYEARTGRRLYRERLGDGKVGFSASPVAADGRLYFTSEDGDTDVIRAGAAFELLASNPIAEVCLATPAISDGMLIIPRTRAMSTALGSRGVRPSDWPAALRPTRTCGWRHWPTDRRSCTRAAAACAAYPLAALRTAEPTTVQFLSAIITRSVMATFGCDSY